VRIAAKVAAEKAEHPERFCSVPRCLWRIRSRLFGETPCRLHPLTAASESATIPAMNLGRVYRTSYSAENMGAKLSVRRSGWTHTFTDGVWPTRAEAEADLARVHARQAALQSEDK
jgi:hypothetical protein